jgi:hypothetical protein
MTGGTNPVATYSITNYTTQDPATYKAGIDANFRVGQRIVDAFAPHAQSSPNMTVALDAGAIFTGAGLIEVAAQNTSTITAPIANPRIDRIVCNLITGSVSVITGTPAGSPVAPAITAGNFPVAQVLLQTSSTSITNSMITDERINNMTIFNLPVKTVSSSSAAITFDLQTGRVFSWTTTEAATVTISNADATGIAQSFKLYLFQDSNGRTITWPGSVKWSNGIAPTLNNASKKYVLGFESVDGGTTWIGTLSAEAYA